MEVCGRHQDPAIREKLVGVSWAERQIADASHLVVFAIKKNLRERDIDDYLGRISEVRGVPRESLGQYREMMVGSLIKRLGDTERNAWA